MLKYTLLSQSWVNIVSSAEVDFVNSGKRVGIWVEGAEFEAYLNYEVDIGSDLLNQVIHNHKQVGITYEPKVPNDDRYLLIPELRLKTPSESDPIQQTL